MMADPAVAAVRQHAVAFDDDTAAARMLEAIDEDASVVLIGEATHGTHEFYRLRADLTRLLIERRGFGVVAAEADWPDAYRANRWVHLLGDDDTAEAALLDFSRFPRWMWRNHDVVRFLRWLRGHNSQRPLSARVGFYGLDLYSLHRSIACVVDYLERVDPAAARVARQRYACFDTFGEDPQAYGYAASRRLARSCEDAVVAQLVTLQRNALEYARRDGWIAADDYFVAEQNARVVKDGEEYYRAMFRGGAASWNLRDRHMMATLQALRDHAQRGGRSNRTVVWAHNSHLGDARATALGSAGELNLGQLVREDRHSASCLIGMTTHTGTVTAARAWDAPAELKDVRPSLQGSYERLFHDTGIPQFLLRLADRPLTQALATPPRLERAIGVIYRPDSERASHYFLATLPGQFDVVVHVDETRALQPLERWSEHDVDLPDTYPSGV